MNADGDDVGEPDVPLDGKVIPVLSVDTVSVGVRAVVVRTLPIAPLRRTRPTHPAAIALIADSIYLSRLAQNLLSTYPSAKIFLLRPASVIYKTDLKPKHVVTFDIQRPRPAS